MPRLTFVQRSTGELAAYQQKMIRIDDHVGIAIAGLTSDARVLRYAFVFCLWKSSVELTVHRVAATSCGNKPCLHE